MHLVTPTSSDPTPGLVIFDCDGVLVDSERLAVDMDVRALAELGWEISREEVIDQLMGRSAVDNEVLIAEQIGRPIPATWSEKWAVEFQQVYAEKLEPVPGAAEAIKTLQAQRYAVCVASSGVPDAIRRNLDKTGLRDLFGEQIFSAADVRRGKPAPDLFLHAATSMGFGPSRCVVVEDSQYGVAAARAGGMAVIGYAGGITPEHHLTKADHVITDMADLAALVAAELRVAAST